LQMRCHIVAVLLVAAAPLATAFLGAAPLRPVRCLRRAEEERTTEGEAVVASTEVEEVTATPPPPPLSPSDVAPPPPPAPIFAEEAPSDPLAAANARGTALFAGVLLINVWLFTLPPSFRRQELCLARTSTNCQSLPEFVSSVADYYKGGGGIVLDFSIQGRD